METEGTRQTWLQRLIIGEHKSAFELATAGDFRPFFRVSLARWLILVGVSAFVAAICVGSGIPRFQFVPTLAMLVAMVGGGGLLLAWKRVTHEFLSYYLVALGPAFGVILWLIGPTFEAAVAVVPAAAAAMGVLYRRRTATIVVSIMVAGYALLVSLADGYPRPFSRIVLIVGVCLGSSDVFARVATQMKGVVDREHAAHAAVEQMRAQLADANAQLESQVQDQVDQIDRLGRLRRFLSPQIADTVLSQGGEDLLATHRRQIAVLFIDLRGFTSFSAVAEPEDVMDLLSEFFAAAGSVLKRLDATVGGFAGDSVMAYFNDPLPCEDPAGRAVEAAMSLRLPMEDLRQRWSRRGHSVGYGVGLAYGYATLGTIGFEERNDYTPIGSVVNLASRLCDEAKHGELLLDGRAYEAVHDAIPADEVTLTLKGFNVPVTAYRATVA